LTDSENTPAYYNTELFTAAKCFIVKIPETLAFQPKERNKFEKIFAKTTFCCCCCDNVG
jgi:hypothetical protein